MSNCLIKIYILYFIFICTGCDSPKKESPKQSPTVQAQQPTSSGTNTPEDGGGAGNGGGGAEAINDSIGTLINDSFNSHTSIKNVRMMGLEEVWKSAQRFNFFDVTANPWQEKLYFSEDHSVNQHNFAYLYFSKEQPVGSVSAYFFMSPRRPEELTPEELGNIPLSTHPVFIDNSGQEDSYFVGKDLTSVLTVNNSIGTATEYTVNRPVVHLIRITSSGDIIVQRSYSGTLSNFDALDKEVQLYSRFNLSGDATHILKR